jgi:hypothetical protein
MNDFVKAMEDVRANLRDKRGEDSDDDDKAAVDNVPIRQIDTESRARSLLREMMLVADELVLSTASYLNDEFDDIAYFGQHTCKEWVAATTIAIATASNSPLLNAISSKNVSLLSNKQRSRSSSLSVNRSAGINSPNAIGNK